jgi:8-oxo-dGTP pyrophosphatase MutT (NUDIX family)
VTGSFDPAAVPVRPAATVLLVRDTDGDGEPDVFMVRRTLSAAFARGMYVFPGGRVDEADAAPEVCELCDGLDDEEASERLRVDRGGLSYWVAAIRECFEEAGVLLARRADDPNGPLVTITDPDGSARFAEARKKIHDGTLSLGELCRREGLRLATDTIHYVSHWVTPFGETRRFDTRFFLAGAPEGQDALHDDMETIESLWVRPSEAFARHESGEVVLMPPTLSNLRFVSGHPSAAAVLEVARRMGTPPPIQPRLRLADDGRLLAIVMPDEPGYDELPAG